MDFKAPQGFEDYLVTILWYFNMDDRSVYEFSETANRKLLDYVQAYGEDKLGYDFALEQLKTGCGFMDRDLLEESDRDLLCQISNCFPEFSVYLENGELEIE
jgi:hypothetical protein